MREASGGGQPSGQNLVDVPRAHKFVDRLPDWAGYAAFLAVKFVAYVAVIFVALLLFGAGARAQVPTSFSDGSTQPLMLWLDGDDPSTILQSETCTGATAGNGVSVGCWLDKSGNDYHVFLENTGDPKPIYRSSDALFGGRGVVDFDTTQSLQNDIPNTSTRNFTLFLVIASDDPSPGNNESFFSNGFAAGDNTSFQITYDQGSNLFELRQQGLSDIAFGAFETNALRLFSVRATDTPSNRQELFNEGQLVNSQNDGQNYNFRVLKVNRNRSGAQRHDSRIAEVILYTEALSSCQMGEVNRYLGLKYGREFSSDFEVLYASSQPENQNIASIGRSATANCSGLDDRRDAGVSGQMSVDVGSGGGVNDTVGDYIGFAHDGGDETQFTTTTVTSAGADYDVSGRTWRLEEDGSGDLGNDPLSFAFDYAAMGLTGSESFVLLVSADRNFANAEIVSTSFTTNAGTVTFDPVTLNPSGDTTALNLEPFNDGTGAGDLFATLATLPPPDRSDAPASYGEPTHTILAGLQLGPAIDADAASIASPNADGDGTDDDGVSTTPLSAGQTATVNVTVNENALNDGYLQAWFDWDESGSFEPGEQVAIDLQDNQAADTNAAVGTISFDVTPPSMPPGILSSQTFARFRWSTAQGLDATTAAPDGEVEDYQVTISNSGLPTGSCVSGDPFTSLAGAYSVPSSGRYCFDLGSGEFEADVDTSEGGGWVLVLQYVKAANTAPNLTFIGAGSNLPVTSAASLGADESANTAQWGHAGNAAMSQFAGDLETRWYGITDNHSRVIHFSTSLGDDYVRTGTGSFSGIQSDFAPLTGHSANLPASSNDFFSNRGDRAFTEFPFFTSMAYHWGIDATAGDPDRWEADDFESPASLQSATIHRIWVRSPVLSDRSDAPAAYGEASHAVVGGLQIGAAIDIDTGSVASSDASGDGTDDDGAPDILNPERLVGTYNVNVTVTNTTGGPATLHGWVDYDLNGVFDADEYASVAVPDGVSGGVVALNWTGLTGGVEGTSFVRVRLTTDAAVTSATPASPASDGEVEDYRVFVVPPSAGDPVPNPTELCRVDDGIVRNDPGVAPHLLWDRETFPLPGGLLLNNVPFAVASGSAVRAGPGITVTQGGNSGNRWTLSDIQATTADESRAFGEYLEFDFTMQADYAGYLDNWGTWNGNQRATLIAIDVARQADFSDAVNFFDGAPQDSQFSHVDGKALQVLEPGETYFVRGYFYGAATSDFDGIGFDIGSCNDRGDGAVATTAVHMQPDGSGLYLGANVPDTDQHTLDTTNGAGDDAAGTDDEDGVTVPVLNLGLSEIIPVSVTQDSANEGYLQAWIDFNDDGDFADAGEQIATDLQSATAGTDTINLNVTIPAGASVGNSFARFRWSSTQGLDATTAALDGEVEDYQVTISNDYVPVLPTNQCQMTYAGWLDAQGTGADEFEELGWTYDSENLPVRPNTTPGTTGTLDIAGISRFPELHDTFTADGNGDSYVMVTRWEAPAGSSQTISVVDPGWAEQSIFAVRDSAGNLLARSPTGSGVNGAVFNVVTTYDLPVTMPGDGFVYVYVWIADGGAFAGQSFPLCADFGDSPLSYGEAGHPFGEAIYLGSSAPDLDQPKASAFDTTDDAAGTRDDTAGNDDEDGVTLPASFYQGVPANISVAVTEPALNDAYLQAWIDWNGDGSFEAGEQVATDLQDNQAGDQNSAAGTIGFTVTPPVAATTSQTFARFRWSTATGLDATTAALDGEVEDYAVTVTELYLPVLPIGVCETTYAGWLISHPGGADSAFDGIAFTSAGWSLDGNDLPIRPNTTPDDTGLRTLADTRQIPELTTDSGAGGVGETHVVVTRYTGVPGANETIVIEDFGAGDHRIYAAIDSAGNLLARSPTTGEHDSSNPTGTYSLGVTVPGDGIVFVHVWIADFSSGFNTSGVYCGDYGDAPGSYEEAGHGIRDGFYLGAALPDREWDDHFADGTGDDTTGTDDEDGVTLPTLATGTPATITVDVTGAGGYLKAWVDWNADGDFDDAGEQIATDLQDGGAGDTDGTAGVIGIAVTPPLNATIGSTFSRFRWSSASGLNASDPAPDGEVEDYTATVEAGVITLTGTVFTDNGLGGGTAHNGSIDGTEAGIGAATLEALYGATVLASATSAADGTYTLILPASADGTGVTLRATLPATELIHISSGPGTGFTDADVLDGEMTITPSAGQTYTADFGAVQPPNLSGDQLKLATPGGVALFPHILTAQSAMSIDVTIANLVQPSGGGVSVTLQVDDNCNGQIDGSETALANPLNLNAGEQACLIARAAAGAGLAQGTEAQFDVQAVATYVGTSESITLRNADRLRIGASGAMTLTKQVCNLTRSTCDLASGAGFGQANTGMPGDTLQYRLVSEPSGAEAVQNVTVSDITPAFSSLTATAPGVVAAPAGLACTLDVPAAPGAGYQGALSWSCTGSLPPGDRLILSFEVAIAN